jgi:hypothetical protein
MAADRWLSPRVHFLIKALGAVALMTYFLATKLYFDVAVLLFAMLLLVGGVLFYAWTSAIFKRATPAVDAPPPGHSAEPWLPASEDGLLLIPLTFIGVNPLTALAVAVLFTLLQMRSRPRSMALALGIPYFFVVLWVLPQGIWMVFVAHVVAELVARKLLESPSHAHGMEHRRA